MPLLPDARFAAAALRILALGDPDLAPSPRVRALSRGRSEANAVFTARSSGGDVVVKIRVDPDDAARREGETTARLGALAAGPLLAYVHARSLVERAFAAGKTRELLDLDLPAGGVLVFRRIEGARLARVDDDHAEAVATAIRALHGARLRLPTAALPEHPKQALSDAAAFLGALDASIPSSIVRGLRAAISSLERPKQKLPAPGRAVVHGDLRRENFIVHERAAHLIDFEHAGLGDPAADLASFAARAPLDENEEFLVLERYLESEAPRGFVDRYFALKPAIAVAGAAFDLWRLLEVGRGASKIAVDAADLREATLARVEDTIARVHRAGGPPRGRATKPGPSRAVTPALKKALVTVDGTACSGKSVSARALASAMGVPYFNMGPLYRAATLVALEQGLVGDEGTRIVRALEKARAALTDDGAVCLRGRRVDAPLYLAAVEARVAEVAALPEVRAFVAATTRAAVGRGAAVVEGRVAGVELFPRAKVKLWFDADLEVRLGRLAMRAAPEHKEAVRRRWLEDREQKDHARALSPARPAADAIVIDTSRLDRGETLARVIASTRKALAR